MIVFKNSNRIKENYHTQSIQGPLQPWNKCQWPKHAKTCSNLPAALFCTAGKAVEISNTSVQCSFSLPFDPIRKFFFMWAPHRNSGKCGRQLCRSKDLFPRKYERAEISPASSHLSSSQGNELKNSWVGIAISSSGTSGGGVLDWVSRGNNRTILSPKFGGYALSWKWNGLFSKQNPSKISSFMFQCLNTLIISEFLWASVEVCCREIWVGCPKPVKRIKTLHKDGNPKISEEHNLQWIQLGFQVDGFPKTESQITLYMELLKLPFVWWHEGLENETNHIVHRNLWQPRVGKHP